MILLQTLSHLHVRATLVSSQSLGSDAVIAARASVSRQQLFPNFCLWNVGDRFKHGLFASAAFWIALVSDRCRRLLLVYRKEQLGTSCRVTFAVVIIVPAFIVSVLQHDSKRLSLRFFPRLGFLQPLFSRTQSPLRFTSSRFPRTHSIPSPHWIGSFQLLCYDSGPEYVPEDERYTNCGKVTLSSRAVRLASFTLRDRG